MDTLARARKHLRDVERKKRKTLQNAMRGAARALITDLTTGHTITHRYGDYDSPVSMRPSTEYSPFDKTDVRQKSLADISQELQDNLTTIRQAKHTRRQSQVERQLSEVVSQDVKDVWNAKIGLASHLDSDVKAKLRDSVRNQTIDKEPEETRDMRLTCLARSFVQRWLYTEGYNPALHTKDVQTSE